ncbi:hypothetical protein [Rhodococcus sp. YH1]|uniref:hypothetical protein n=1 Tax=Rhodococcus sp. YH1 TaxID=89066 RepID=UPI001386ABFD|nr:hypothetical protein [Rhodococcus sp. YH1]
MQTSHRHHWTEVSRHPTSEGVVHYQRCACGRWHMVATPLVADPIGVSATVPVTPRP